MSTPLVVPHTQEMSNSRLEQIGAAGGIVFVVLQMAAQALIQVGGAEPPFDATTETIIAFFMARNSQLFALGEYLSTLSLIAFLCCSRHPAMEGYRGRRATRPSGHGPHCPPPRSPS